MTIKQRIQIMGVVNATPNSFSDGGQFLDYDHFRKRIWELINQGVHYIDVGAESTAPFNDPISEEEEKDRLQRTLLRFLREENWPSSLTLSLDTYRFSTFSFLYKTIRQMNKNQEIPLLWNDVSGVFNEDSKDHLVRFLKEECPGASYVFSHSHIPQRDQTLCHQQFIKREEGEEFLRSLQEYFLKAREKFLKANLQERILFDPGFGFSKTRSQNLYLLQHLNRLGEGVGGFPQTWLIGISKKSFLRERPELRDEKTLQETEFKHCYLLAKWIQELPSHHLIFRVHNPAVVTLAQTCAQNFPFAFPSAK